MPTTGTTERFCSTCGALKIPSEHSAPPLAFCTHCGNAQYSKPQEISSHQKTSHRTTVLLHSFKRKLFGAVILTVVLGSSTFALTRVLITSGQSENQSNVKRNSAQNNNTENNTAGGQNSANPMSRITPEMQQRIQVLQDSLRQFPNNGELLLHLANAWYDVGAYFQAEQHYARYLTEFNKANVAARVDYAYTLLRQNRTEEAIAETKKALEYEPNRVEALYNLGVIYYGQQNWSESTRWFEQCLKNAPPGSEVATSAAEIIKMIDRQKSASEKEKM